LLDLEGRRSIQAELRAHLNYIILQIQCKKEIKYSLINCSKISKNSFDFSSTGVPTPRGKFVIYSIN
jgi:hypothetical protein